MPRQTVYQSNFTAGEWSPRLKSRTDLDRYLNSCAWLENMIMFPLGGVTRRSGTRYLGDSLSHAAAGRLIPFEFSSEQAHVLEFGDGALVFWRDDVRTEAPTVAAAITNGDFAGGITGWTDASTGGASIAWDSGNARMNLVGASGETAAARQAVTTTSTGTEHVVRFQVANGPLSVRVGSTAGGEELMEDRACGEGWHTIAFTPSASPFYLEFRHETVFTRAVDSIAVVSGAAVQITTPYATADLDGLRWTQSADILYLLHPDHAPRRLERYGLRAWSLERVNWQDGPYLDENLSDVTLTPSGTSGSVTLTASQPLFDPGHLNSVWRLTHEGTTESASITEEDNYTDDIKVSGSVADVRVVNVIVNGTFTATVTLQRSYDGGLSFVDVETYTGDTGKSFTDPTVGQDVYYRLGVKTGDFSSGTVELQISTPTGTTDGWCRVTAYSSATVVVAEVGGAFGSSAATKKWREGAWSGLRGWPALAAFYEQRMIVARTTCQPQTLWGSRSGDIETFTPGSEDSDGLAFTIASGRVNTIRWIEPARELLLGTSGPEFSMTGGTDRALTPTNVFVRPQTEIGSKDLSPVRAFNAILFAQRESRKIHSISYRYELDGYVSPNISLLADHLLLDGVADLEWSPQHDGLLWVRTATGELRSFTYLPEESVQGWARQNLGGIGVAVESTCAVPSSAGRTDLWLLVRRTIDGTTKRYIERMEPPFAEDALAEDGFFVDCGLTYDGRLAATLTPGATSGTGVTFTANPGVFSAGDVGKMLISGAGAATITGYSSATSVTATIETAFASTAAIAAGDWALAVESVSGATHLAGETVTICADGATHADKVVSAGGAIALDRFAGVVHVGFGYRSVVAPMPLNAGTAGGDAQGKLKRVSNVLARLHRCVGLFAGPTLDRLRSIAVRLPGDAMTAGSPLQTAIIQITPEGPVGRETTYYVGQTDPLPFTLLSVAWEVSGSDGP